MPRDLDAITADLDNLEADDKAAVDDNLPDEQQDEEQDEATPGFVSHQEWIDSGKDEKDYRGENAYKSQYDSIQANKALKTEMSEMKGMLTDVVDAAEQTKKNQAAAYKSELEKQLAEQTEAMQTKEALATQKAIDAIDDTPAAPKINPVISTFLTKNPILDTESDQYNQEFAEDMISFHNAGADAMGGRTSVLSDGQVQRIMAKAFTQTKELHPDLFSSPRNNRGGANRGKGKGNNAPVGKLSEYKIDDDTDPRNQNAATAMYEMIKKKNPKKAEQFRKNLLS